MPAKPSFSATVAEWRTVLAALRYYQKHLAEVVPNIGNTDEDLVIYDHMERLDRIVPNFDRQLKEYIQQATSLVHSS